MHGSEQTQDQGRSRQQQQQQPPPGRRMQQEREHQEAALRTERTELEADCFTIFAS